MNYSSRTLNPKQIRYVCKNYGKFSTKKLADKLKTNNHVIIKVLKNNNIKIKPYGFYNKKPFSQNKINNIIKMYKKFNTIKSISKKHKCSTDTINKLFKKHKIKTRSTGFYSSKFDLVKLKKIKVLYLKGHSVKSLSKKYKLSVCSLIRYLKRIGTKTRTISESLYRGKKQIDKKGYIKMIAPFKYRHICGNKNKMEHRIVMEIHLNRPLLPTETVHHINGNRQDNRIENLQLWSNSQPSGQRVKDKLKYAKEIIKLYDKDVKMGRIK